MKNDMKLTSDCKTCHAHLADLLLDETYAVEHPEMTAHLAECAGCRAELAELKSTFALLDHWTAPEPSPFFDTRLHARLREAEASAPEGLWERVRSFLLFSTGRSLRPAMAGALALAMIAGGGGVLLGVHPRPGPVAASPTVNDLKIMDNNAQALQQMDQLLDSSGDDTFNTTNDLMYAQSLSNPQPCVLGDAHGVACRRGRVCVWPAEVCAAGSGGAESAASARNGAATVACAD